MWRQFRDSFHYDLRNGFLSLTYKPNDDYNKITIIGYNVRRVPPIAALSKYQIIDEKYVEMNAHEWFFDLELARVFRSNDVTSEGLPEPIKTSIDTLIEDMNL